MIATDIKGGKEGISMPLHYWRAVLSEWRRYEKAISAHPDGGASMLQDDPSWKPLSSPSPAGRASCLASPWLSPLPAGALTRG